MNNHRGVLVDGGLKQRSRPMMREAVAYFGMTKQFGEVI